MNKLITVFVFLGLCLLTTTAISQPDISLWKISDRHDHDHDHHHDHNPHHNDEKEPETYLVECGDEYYVTYNGQDQELHFAIKNEGDRNLTIWYALRMSFASDRAFSIQQQPDKRILKPGEMSNFIVSYQSPEQYKDAKAEIVIRSNDPDERNCSLRFDVGVVEPEIQSFRVNGGDWNGCYNRLDNTPLYVHKDDSNVDFGSEPGAFYNFDSSVEIVTNHESFSDGMAPPNCDWYVGDGNGNIDLDREVEDLNITYYSDGNCETQVEDPYSSTCSSCPGLENALIDAVRITDSSCDEIGGTPSGGIIRPPFHKCPEGSTMMYSTDGNNYSATLPTYDQEKSMEVWNRCECNESDAVNEGNVVDTEPGICPECPELGTAPTAKVTESTCDEFGGTPEGGKIEAPSPGCPRGSTIMYSTDGSSFSASLPTYDNDASMTVYTRCDCEDETSSVSQVTTKPGQCPECPELGTAPTVKVTESTCDEFGGTPMGGEIEAPNPGCPEGSTIMYSTDGSSFSASLPGYNKNASMTIYTRCDCGEEKSSVSQVTTDPGKCPECPDLSNATAPVARVTSESSCEEIGGSPEGGVIAVPTGDCPDGSTLMYSTDGENYSTTLPEYDQDGVITVYTRCDCGDDEQSKVAMVTTQPGNCPECPDLSTTTAPVARVASESTCEEIGGSPDGGVIAGPVSSCPQGSTIMYSTDGTNYSNVLPNYNQSRSITVYSRCECGDQSSKVAKVTTNPGSCPGCPDLRNTTAPVVRVLSESSCNVVGGTPGGGVLAAPIGNCPELTTLMYSTDNVNFSTDLPAYNQTTSITVYTRCDCGDKASPVSMVTTSPGSCPRDSDNDGVIDAEDGCPFDPLKIFPGDCGCGVPDSGDFDQDGTPDCIDGCPTDPAKTAPGVAGCNVAEPLNPTSDVDGDGTYDYLDGCPRDPKKVSPGVCGCGIPDGIDSDNDGEDDCTDECPNNPFKNVAGRCGCDAPAIIGAELGDIIMCDAKGTEDPSDDTYMIYLVLEFDYPPNLGGIQVYKDAGYVSPPGVVIGGEFLAEFLFPTGNTTQTEFSVKLTLPADGEELDLLSVYKRNEACSFRLVTDNPKDGCSDGICDEPGNVTSSVEGNKATLNWTAAPNGISYQYRYRPLGSTDEDDWKTDWSNETTGMICNLNGQTTYEYEIRTLCDEDQKSPFVTGIFTTGSGETPCAISGEGEGCMVTSVQVINIRDCSDHGGPNDQSLHRFDADIVVTYSNAPADATLAVTGNGASLSTSVAAGSGSHTFNDVELTEGNSNIALTASLGADCSFTTDIPIASNPCHAGRLEGINGTNIASEKPAIDRQPFVHIYPNPAKDELQIAYQFSAGNKVETGQILLFDILGQQVIVEKEGLTTNQHTLNISHLQEGVYHLLIQRGGEVLTKKMVKQ